MLKQRVDEFRKGNHFYLVNVMSKHVTIEELDDNIGHEWCVVFQKDYSNIVAACPLPNPSEMCKFKNECIFRFAKLFRDFFDKHDNIKEEIIKNLDDFIDNNLKRADKDGRYYVFIADIIGDYWETDQDREKDLGRFVDGYGR